MGRIRKSEKRGVEGIPLDSGRGGFGEIRDDRIRSRLTSRQTCLLVSGEPRGLRRGSGGPGRRWPKATGGLPF